MVEYTVKVTGDTNDGDYITEESVLTQEGLDYLKYLVKMIRERSGNPNSILFRWGTGELEGGEYGPEKLYPFLSEENIEFITNLCPYGEYGIHSVESIEYSPKVNWERI